VRDGLKSVSATFALSSLEACLAGLDPATANGIAWTSIFAKDIRSLSVDLNSVPKKARAEGICAIKKRVWPRRHRNGAS
jgi:hypothetical protein